MPNREHRAAPASRWQVPQLEKLYRQAVRLQANPAGGLALCEAGCGRIGRDAHHVVFRSQEPGIRWKYEPRWGLWLCVPCHGAAHVEIEPILARLRNRRRVLTIYRYMEMHDRLKCRPVTFAWMRAYLQRCIERLQAKWSDAYYCEGVY
jgi:hypothetical protein